MRTNYETTRVFVTVGIIFSLCYLIATPVRAELHGPLNTPADFSLAIKHAQPGDTLVIADGRYEDWSAQISIEATLKKPVTIKPQSLGGVTFTGATQFSFSGRHVIMTGLQFDRCDLSLSTCEFERAQHCRIEACTFQHGSGVRAVIRLLSGARQNTITDCRFIHIAGRSILLPLKESTAEHGIPVGNVICRNLFRDIPSLNANGRETVKIGSSQPKYGHLKTETVVEDNTFVRCNGEGEIVSNKCSGNIYRRNLFFDCQGELVMRGGGDCLIESNRIIRCSGGIRLSGTRHTVKNNVIVGSRGTGIRLLYGMTKKQGGHYQAATDCQVINNTIINAARAGIWIGEGRNKNWLSKGIQNIAPENNRFQDNIITGNRGDLLIAIAAPNNTIDANVFHQQGEALLTHPGQHPRFIDPQFPALGIPELGIPTRIGDGLTASDSIALENFASENFVPGVSLPGKGALTTTLIRRIKFRSNQ